MEQVKRKYGMDAEVVWKDRKRYLEDEESWAPHLVRP